MITTPDLISQSKSWSAWEASQSARPEILDDEYTWEDTFDPEIWADYYSDEIRHHSCNYACGSAGYCVVLG